ncbi:MAG TPA: glycosyltransferase family 87 protein, partial [Terriglobales bacterium]|nr:glycosyltransferase family 87 protein [Terriglobales bacterium]
WDLYDLPAFAAWQHALVPASAGGYLAAFYGPQVYLAFWPLARLSYGWAVIAWALLNCAVYLACCYAVWRCCPRLQPHAGTVFLLAIAFPGFFNLIAFGQTSGPALALFTLAFLALRSQRMFLAGLAIGLLIYKPQLGLAAAVVFLVAAEWKVVAGAIAGAAAQIAFAWAWFGTTAMRQYFGIWLTPHPLAFIEPKLYEMESLRGFWLLLLPWQNLAGVLYVITAIAALAVAWVSWRSRGPLPLRYSALLLATVLAPPHCLIYDLVILAPAFLLTANWVLEHEEASAGPALGVFLYAAYALPLLEPLAKLSHIQLSVLGFVALEWLVWRALSDDQAGGRHRLQTAGASG